MGEGRSYGVTIGRARASIDDAIESYNAALRGLTARAEKAERERDAARAKVTELKRRLQHAGGLVRNVIWHAETNCNGDFDKVTWSEGELGRTFEAIRAAIEGGDDG